MTDTDLFGNPIPARPTPAPKPEKITKTQRALFDNGENDLRGQGYMFDDETFTGDSSDAGTWKTQK